MVGTQNWYNSDGLLLKFGTDKATANKAGEYKTYGSQREIELKLDLTTLTTTLGGTIVSDTTFFPKQRIESVTIEVETAATGTGATLDFGLIGTDRATEIDFNGFIAAETKANLDTAGKKITYIFGTSGAGALIGTTTTSVGYLVANANTALFTAGVVYIRIMFRPD